MKRTTFVALIALMLTSIVYSGVAFADDIETCSTDPDSELPECFTPEDNECYEGGEMEGRCETDYDWIFGWYLARVRSGQMSYDDVPEAYHPAEQAPEPTWTSSGSGGSCVLLPMGNYFPPTVLAGLGSSISIIQGYDDAGCSIPTVHYALFVEANPATAVDTCDADFGGPGAGAVVDYRGAYPDLWRCNKAV